MWEGVAETNMCWSLQATWDARFHLLWDHGCLATTGGIPYPCAMTRLAWACPLGLGVFQGMTPSRKVQRWSVTAGCAGHRILLRDYAGIGMVPGICGVVSQLQGLHARLPSAGRCMRLQDAVSRGLGTALWAATGIVELVLFTCGERASVCLCRGKKLPGSDAFTVHLVGVPRAAWRAS